MMSTLKEGEVHVWRIDLTTPAKLSISILDEYESERYCAFGTEPLRLYYARAHIAVREILASYLNRCPDDIVLERTTKGRPQLASKHQSSLNFNLSHSGDWALLAITNAALVGVDIERMKSHIDCAGILERFCAPDEYKQWQTFPKEQQLAAFYRCWVRKEAYLKALGVGISEHLQEFVVNLSASGAGLVMTKIGLEKSSHWSLPLLSAPPGYQAALAIRCSQLEITNIFFNTSIDITP